MRRGLTESRCVQRLRRRPQHGRACRNCQCAPVHEGIGASDYMLLFAAFLHLCCNLDQAFVVLSG